MGYYTNKELTASALESFNLGQKLYQEDIEKTGVNNFGVIDNPLLGDSNSSNATDSTIGHIKTNDSADTVDFRKNHYAQYINAGKITEIAFRNKPTTKADWDKWRSKNVNKVFNVDSRVLLIPDNSNLSMKFSYETDKGGDIANKVGSAIDTIKNGAEFFMALQGKGSPKTAITEYDVPQTFKDMSVLTIDGSLKFNFYFGMAGIFSGLEEVIKPIYALASSFAPKTLMGSGGAIEIEAPWLTNAGYLGTMLRSGGKAISDALNPDKAVETTSTDLAASALEAATALKGVFAAASKDVANGFGSPGILYFRYGPFVCGPVQPKDFTFDFDMDMLDEFGFPSKGSFTINGISWMRKATAGAILSTLAYSDGNMGYDVKTTGVEKDTTEQVY